MQLVRTLPEDLAATLTEMTLQEQAPEASAELQATRT
jgi:hypothetical protein